MENSRIRQLIEALKLDIRQYKERKNEILNSVKNNLRDIYADPDFGTLTEKDFLIINEAKNIFGV